ncbi:TSUP family transporter [Paenibacillus albicereus]|uniref:Probable membrane transporter protein n=1 Tax=Paenibacillus albicereus TaxID=2726185 RepID=A0A6H2GU52_9BACL|nr:TSUP family transporter [Paenibacillus albicereus]QJC50927.1 TSUP family transporter [Paenibacillus albicereus]
MSWELFVWIAAGGFLAAFVDSVVGGGGLVSVPVLLTAGLPPHLALGTNKLAGTMGSLTSMLAFLRSGKIEGRVVWRLFPLTVIGAAGGTLLLQLLPSDWLRPLVVVLLALITIYTVFKRSWGVDGQARRAFTRRSAVLIACAAFALGGYDGFFGPGTGSFLIFVFLMAGYDFVRAAGNAKVLNFGSNVASLATFAVLQSIDWTIGLTMGAFMVLGSLVGSRLAIRRGAKYVRPLFIAVSVLLLLRQAWELLRG